MLLVEPFRREELQKIYRDRQGAQVHQGMVQRTLPPGTGLPGLHHLPHHRSIRGTLPQSRLLRLRPDLRHARRDLPRRPPAIPPPPRHERRLRDMHRRPPRRRQGPRRRHHHLPQRDERGGRVRARGRGLRSRQLLQGVPAPVRRSRVRVLGRRRGPVHAGARSGYGGDCGVVEAELRPGAGGGQWDDAGVRQEHAGSVGVGHESGLFVGEAGGDRGLGVGGVFD
mmetsp:Transcript_1458/g.2184  ORF Transcript_1458/g.2184 Transcript_1458/m.2184 type:complete len:225 (+) Transcript_1458:826-1500(+)